jgi:hypothetical protein
MFIFESFLTIFVAVFIFEAAGANFNQVKFAQISETQCKHSKLSKNSLFDKSTNETNFSEIL